MTASTVDKSGLRLHADEQRIAHWLDTFAALSEPDSGPGVTRLAHTPLERRAHALFTEHLTGLGLTVRTDAVGNTIAELPGTRESAPALGTGSHLDSVPNAGAFDGIAGVVAAMETARLYTDHGVRLNHPVRFVVFAAEEGARFGQACTGSRVVAGLTAAADLETKVDANGISLADAMRSVGLDPAGAAGARWDPADWAAFVELHIEQGSVLESTGLPLGVVDLISGSTRFRLDLTGRASHTGGTPMHQRADTLAAAAEIVLLVEAIATDSRHHGTRATVGRLDSAPGSITTIAGQAQLHVDVRDVDSDRQRQTAAEIIERAHAVAARRGVGFSAHALADASPVLLPRRVTEVVAATCAELGHAHRVLPSGASHDAQMVNHVTPAGMLFVPSRDGVSHSPDEWTDVADIVRGTEVLAHSLLALDSAFPVPAVPGRAFPVAGSEDA
ncbi:Zn-dependent hydrolase [Amycolatopsis rhabdoformis]|uniref:Zn-dependent hydrolase n=1 Tax=Amycolatopsis rhabdoformis TaxID=1448059 RepID=A0ABZ1ICN4_9PSEU|nr:Zn-dependent hydrolase [Amycolatopsis rhabdoformis]WSE31791.1 Zn-dependent hydrolase [Amycolatopsis rhabdoformis]